LLFFSVYFVYSVNATSALAADALTTKLQSDLSNHLWVSQVRERLLESFWRLEASLCGCEHHGALTEHEQNQKPWVAVRALENH
jgi:hypothetical protein